VRSIISTFVTMKTWRILLLFLVISTTSVFAQKQYVVVDLETDLPIGGVNVQVGHSHYTTDSLGRFSLGDNSRSMLFSHVNYESRLVNVEEVHDTVFLISKLLNLKEVVVFGKGRLDDDGLRELNKQLRMTRTEAQLAAADPSKGFGIPLGMLSKLLPKKWRKGQRKEEQRKHHEEVLREY